MSTPNDDETTATSDPQDPDALDQDDVDPSDSAPHRDTKLAPGSAEPAVDDPDGVEDDKQFGEDPQELQGNDPASGGS